MSLLFDFRRIYDKIVNPDDMLSLKEDVVVTMSILKIHMPSSIFDVISHLVLHLVKELELCRPVQTRWMYSVERMNKVLKGYVNNMARPKACMMKSYVLDEAIRLVAEFMVEEYEPPTSQGMVRRGCRKDYQGGPARSCNHNRYYTLCERYCPRVYALKLYIVPTTVHIIPTSTDKHS